MNKDEVVAKLKKAIKGLHRFPTEQDDYCLKCDSLDCDDDSHLDYWIDLKSAEDFLIFLKNAEEIEKEDE